VWHKPQTCTMLTVTKRKSALFLCSIRHHIMEKNCESEHYSKITLGSDNFTARFKSFCTSTQKTKFENSFAYRADGAFHPLVFPEYGNRFCLRNVLSLFYFRRMYCRMSEQKMVPNKVLQLGVAKCT